MFIGGIGHRKATPMNFGSDLKFFWNFSNAGKRTVATGISQQDSELGDGRNLVEASGTKQPAVTVGLNGREGAKFDGTNDVLDWTGSVALSSAGLCAMLVFDSMTLGGRTQFVINPIAAHIMYMQNLTGPNRLDIESNLGGAYRPAWTWTGTQILCVNANAAGAMTSRSNGTALASGSSGTPGGTATFIELGAWDYYSFGYSDMRYYAFAIMDGANANLLDRHELFEGWAAHEWNTQSVLPSGHRFKVAPPLG